MEIVGRLLLCFQGEMFAVESDDWIDICIKNSYVGFFFTAFVFKNMLVLVKYINGWGHILLWCLLFLCQLNIGLWRGSFIPGTFFLCILRYLGDFMYFEVFGGYPWDCASVYLHFFYHSVVVFFFQNIQEGRGNSGANNHIIHR